MRSSPAHARQNGKPVVCIWGFGSNQANKAFPTSACLDVIKWFKSLGCYVVGGVPTRWLPGIEDSRPGYLNVYNINQQDQADSKSHSIDYQPCLIPGDLQSGHRSHGDLMWLQFYETSAWVQRIGHSRAQRGRRWLLVGLLPAPHRPTAARCSSARSPITATSPTQPVLNQGGGLILHQDVDYAAGRLTYCLGQLHSRPIAGGWHTRPQSASRRVGRVHCRRQLLQHLSDPHPDTPNFIAVFPTPTTPPTSRRIP